MLMLSNIEDHCDVVLDDGQDLTLGNIGSLDAGTCIAKYIIYAGSGGSDFKRNSTYIGSAQSFIIVRTVVLRTSRL